MAYNVGDLFVSHDCEASFGLIAKIEPDYDLEGDLFTIHWYAHDGETWHSAYATHHLDQYTKDGDFVRYAVKKDV